MSKQILVTGGAGFIGSFLVDKLIEKGHSVTVYDNLEPQVHPAGLPPDYLNPACRFVQGDVRDYESFKKVISDAEIIFHEAAMVGVGQSQYEIKKYIDINTSGTANLLDIVVNHKNKVEKIMVAASMSSYGEGPAECSTCGKVSPHLREEKQMERGDWELYCPLCGNIVQPVSTTEDDQQNCNSIYAFSKKDQEDMVLNIGRTYSLPVVALRYFNVFGPRQSLSNPYTGVAAIFLSRLKNDKAPVVYEDGLQSRDFVSVHDIVQANLLAMEKPEADYEVFNVGSGNPLRIIDIAKILANLLGKDLSPEITNKFRKGDVRHCFADIGKISRQLGYKPSVSFEDGMKELVEWSDKEEANDYFDKACEELKAKGLL